MTNAGKNILFLKVRQANGWTQRELAERLGVTTITVGRWERGDAVPTRQNIAVLSQICRMTPQELGFFSEVSSQEPALDEHFSILDPMLPLSLRLPLIGRDETLSRIKMQFLIHDTPPVQVAFNGLPGAGKTALATALAYDPDIREHFSDGILWAGMGQKANVEGILSRWSRLFRAGANSSNQQREIWTNTLREFIGRRRFLIILDDAWSLDDALALKVGGDQCAYVLTTRLPALAAEFALEAAIQITELNEEESLDLLKLLAPEITNTSREIRRTLVHATGMLPLALTLAGKYVHSQAYQRPLRRLHTSLEQLLDVNERVRVSQPTTLIEYHPSLPIGASLSLQTLIAVSDEHLDPLAQSALRALSAFPPKPNTFSEEAALAVAACTIETLDALTDIGLLESTGAKRYTLHQTIADYAMTNQINTDLAVERLITFLVSFVEVNQMDHEILELERDTIFAALNLAYGIPGKQEAFIQITCAFVHFLFLRGLYNQAKTYLLQANSLLETRDDIPATLTCLHSLGMVSQKQGEYQQATEYYQKGLILARRNERSERMCELLADLGWISAKRGRYAEAHAYAQEGLDIVDQTNDPDQRCKLLTILGVVADNRGEFIQAEKYYREGLILALQNNDKEQQCIILNDLGVNASERGLWKEAFQFYQEVRQLAIQMKHLEWHCLALLNLSTYYIVQEDYASASQYNEEALHFTRQLGQREWECFALIIQGSLALRGKKNYDQAKVLLQEGLALAAEIEKPHYICDALKFLGDLALECQRIEDAATFYAQMGQFIPSGHKGLNAENLYRLGLVAAARQETQEAKNLGEAALALFQEIGHRSKDEVRQWVAMDCPPSLPISI